MTIVLCIIYNNFENFYNLILLQITFFPIKGTLLECIKITPTKELTNTKFVSD